MKKLKYYFVLLFGLVSLLVNCDDDYDLIICDSCSSSSPWSVWSLDLSNPCFETKSKCEDWARNNLAGDQWKCQICDE